MNGATRVVNTNSPAFAESVLRVVDRWRYAPARRGGRQVAQLVRARYELSEELRASQPAEATWLSRREPARCR